MLLPTRLAGSLMLSVPLLISGCASLAGNPDSLTFSPSTGDSRRYDIYTNTFLEVDGEWGSDYLTIDSDMIVDYEVLGSGRHLRIAMQPEYFWMDMDDRTVASFGPIERGTAVMRELMESGFELTIDARSGELEDITNRNEDLWRTIQEEDEIAPLIDQLEQQVTRPGPLFPGISLIEGETVTVEEPEGFQEVTLTTRTVTGTEVTVALEGKGENDARIAGVMVLERDTGWLSRLALYTNSSFEAQGHSGRSSQLVVMIADGAAPYSAKGVTEYTGQFEGKAYLEEGPAPEQVEEYQEQARQTDLIIPADAFGFRYSPPSSFSGQPYLDLEIDHAFHPFTIPGAFDITDLELSDASGEVIPIRFHNYQTGTGLFGTLPQVMTWSRQIPLGWNTDLERLENLERITAQGTYRPVTVEPLVLPLDPHNATEMTVNGASARAVPTGEPDEFELYLEETESHWFSERLHAPVTMEATTLRDASFAEWLGEANQELFYQVGRSGRGPGNLRLSFPHGSPEELVFYVISNADEEAQAFELTFIQEDELYKDLDRAPTYQGMMDRGMPFDPDAEEPAPLPVQRMADIHLPETAEGNTLSVSLPEPLAGLCEFGLVEAPAISGTPLTWRTNGEMGDQQDSWARSWQLETEDGVRSYFYDISVTAEIQCPSIQGWQAMDLDTGERPWLVDVTQLPGDPDLAQPMTEFISRYRFFGSYGWELPPLPLEKPFFFHDFSGGIEGPPTLEDYLIDGRWLRIAGKVERAEYLALGDEPEVRRWTVQFPPLP